MSFSTTGFIIFYLIFVLNCGFKSSKYELILTQFFKSSFRAFEVRAFKIRKVYHLDLFHHPDIELGWGRVGITLTTHAIKGLSENDFIVAAKINEIA